jgi:hypothetical protein
VSTQHLGTWTGNNCKNCARTTWVLKHQHGKRGNSIFEKKIGNIGSADSKVGNDYDAGFFPEGKDRFVYKERGEQRIVLKMFVLLYNMRARIVGINKIQNTYMPHLERDPNEDVWFKSTKQPPGLGEVLMDGRQGGHHKILLNIFNY